MKRRRLGSKSAGFILAAVMAALAVLGMITLLPGTAKADEAAQSGFDTSEEAVQAYIQGLVNGDPEEMLAACAIEVYVDHYDMEKQLERTQISPIVTYNTYLPGRTELERRLNLYTRYNNMAQQIRYQYLNLSGAKAVSNDGAGKVFPLKDYDSAADMITDLYGTGELQVRFEGEMLPPLLVEQRYYSSMMQYNIARAAYTDNADQIKSEAALIYANDKPFLLTLGTECFDGRWYVTDNNILSMMIGLSNMSGGVISMEEALRVSLDEFRELMAGLEEDETLQSLLIKLPQITEELDLDAVFSLPSDEWKDAFEQMYMEKVQSTLTEEEYEYMDHMDMN